MLKHFILNLTVIILIIANAWPLILGYQLIYLKLLGVFCTPALSESSYV